MAFKVQFTQNIAPIFLLIFCISYTTSGGNIQLSSCQLRLNNGSEINLKEVASHDLQLTPRFSNIHPRNKSDDAIYSYNPCNTFIYPPGEGKFGPCTKDVAVCRSGREGNTVIGNQESSVFVYNVTSQIWSIVYKGTYGDKRTVVHLICTDDDDDKLDVFGRTKEGTHTEEYRMTLISRCACPDVCGTPILPRGMSVASLVVLLLLGAATTYLLLGCFYRRVVVGARGVEALPHHTWWLQLPHNTHKAFYYVVRCGQPPVIVYERI